MNYKVRDRNYKVCTRCKKEKNSTQFRKRYKYKLFKKYYYRNPTCRQCEAELTREYYNANKHDEKFKQKNINNANRYWEENRESVLLKLKRKRETPEYQKYRREYDKKNRARIKSLQKVRSKKWHDNSRDNLTDGYIISKLIQKSGITKEEVLQHPELIEAYRANIKLKRLISKKNGGQGNRQT